MLRIQRRSRLELWSDVIFALLIRQLTSKFNDKFGVSWLIIQPVSFILVLSLLKGRLGDSANNGIPTFVFMMLGIVTVFQFLSSWGSVSSVIKKDKPLYAFRQVLPIASILTTIFIELITKIVVMSVLCFSCYILKINLQVSDPLRVFLYLLEIQLIAFSIGMIFGISKLFVGEISKLEQLLKRPLIFISGAFFTLSELPEAAWPYLTWNPILHAVELARGHSYPSFEIVSAISSTYLHLFTLTVMFIALALYFIFWKKAVSR